MSRETWDAFESSAFSFLSVAVVKQSGSKKHWKEWFASPYRPQSLNKGSRDLEGRSGCYSTQHYS